MVSLQAANPHPVTELTYTNHFTLLVAVVLSAQATDISVNRATNDLFRHASDPQQMIALGEEGIIRCIHTIGLWKTKAKNILSLSKQLIDHFDSQVPRTMEALQSLPGVGRKTANVVLNVAFKQPTIAVDTHIFRVSNRTGLAPGHTPEEVEQRLLIRIPQRFVLHAHHWLVLHGRYICKARKPDCRQCVAIQSCQFEDKFLYYSSPGKVK